MTNFKNKSTNEKIELIVKFLCLGILFLYAIFRVGIPLVFREPLYLDENDGWVVLICGSIVLVIETVKLVLGQYLKFLANRKDSSKK